MYKAMEKEVRANNEIRSYFRIRKCSEKEAVFSERALKKQFVRKKTKVFFQTRSAKQ